MNGLFKQLSLWLVILIIGVLLFGHFSRTTEPTEKLWSKDFDDQLFFMDPKNPEQRLSNVKAVEIHRLPDEQFRFKVTLKEPIRDQMEFEFQNHQFPDAWRDELVALWESFAAGNGVVLPEQEEAEAQNPSPTVK